MWGYSKQNGPDTWHKEFPVANGVRQSPIDIEVQKCPADKALCRIQCSYDNIAIGALSNTGSSWKAQITGGKSSLHGGPLSDEFVLEQFHCHWGKSNETGSEHTVNGKKYAAELHLVHWNKDKFKTFGDAAAADNGLTVLGIFLKIGRENVELSKITKLLPFIKFKGQAISLVETVNPALMLPSDTSYWTYQGSLTTPPLYESVNWVVYENPVEISEAQITAFRNLRSYHPCEKCPEDELAGHMVENYRPPCPIKNRTVREFKEARMENMEE